MMRKLTFVIGIGAGYVLGTKAGRERYDQIVAKARELARRPAVQEASNNVQQVTEALADKARSKVNNLSDGLVDLTTTEDKAPARTQP